MCLEDFLKNQRKDSDEMCILISFGWSGFSPKRHFPEAAFPRTGISPNALIRVGSPNDLRRAFGELKAAFHLLLPFTEWTINSL